MKEVEKVFIERNEETKRLKSKIRYSVCADLFNDLKEVRYAVVKGEPLSVMAYGREGQRSSSDIDILISKEDISYLEKVLRNNGFSFCSDITREERVFYVSQSHQLMPYVKKTALIDVVIDVNFDVFWGEYSGKRISIKEFLDDAVEIEIYGKRIKTLKPEKAFIHLCLHHFKELNSIYLLYNHNFYTLKTFDEVNRMILSNFSISDISNVVFLCKELRVTEYVYFVVYYTQRLFPSIIVNELLKRLSSDKGDELIEFYGLDENRRSWRIPFEERINKESVREYISYELNKDDLRKIEINSKYFM